MFEGIRVRGFILFQDETVEYQVLEIDEDGNEKCTEPVCLNYVDQMEKRKAQWLPYVKQYAFQTEYGDEELLDLMQEYAEKRRS